MLALGIQPTVLSSFGKVKFAEMQDKIASSASKTRDVIQNLTASSLYAVPLMLEKEGLADAVCYHLGMDNPEPDLEEWKKMVKQQENTTRSLKVALVGKYVALPDAYISVMESLRHASFANDASVEINLVQAEEVTAETAETLLGDADAILVPGGFGDRGIEGKIQAVHYAREKKIPYLGLCLGMHMATIEFARYVCGMDDANSAEFADSEHKVIDLMPDQRGVEMGGTMRLGLYPCKLENGTISREVYGEELSTKDTDTV